MSEKLPSPALFGMADLITNYQQDPLEIATKVQLDPDALYRHDLVVEELVFNDFLEEAAQQCGDRFFALKLAEYQSWQILGDIWELMKQANTLKTMMEILAKHLESHSHSLSLILLEDSLGVSLCYEVRMGNEGLTGIHSSRVQVVELGSAITCFELRKLLGKSWRPDYVQFRHSAPTNPAPLQQIFGEKVLFNQDVNAIHVNDADYHRALNDERLFTIHASTAETNTPKRHPPPFSILVDRAIRQLINHDVANVTQVAASLNITPRTLQHRLQQSGTSYQELFDTARLDMALEYMNTSNLSIAAIGERLGFKDPAAFSKFFKKKTQLSPRQYLQQHQ